MASGNTKDNRTKSPIIGDAGISATPAELRELTKHAIELFNMDNPDLHDYDSCYAAIMRYFESCDRHGVRPANLGLYAALGLTKQDVSDILAGKNKSKVSPPVVDLLRKSKQVLSTYRESLALSGKLNPVTAIFWAKNFDQMQDSTVLEVSPINNREANLTPDQIRAAINTGDNNAIESGYTPLLSDNSQTGPVKNSIHNSRQ